MIGQLALIFLLAVTNHPSSGPIKEVKYHNNPPDLHLNYSSKNADFVGLSNDQFFTVPLKYRHIVANWCGSDHLSLRHVREGRILKGIALSNKTTNEEIHVVLFPMSPAKYTLDQPSYPYLHLKYVNKEERRSLRRILLSDGTFLVVPREDHNTLTSWSCSDSLFYQNSGLFSSPRLYNMTNGQSIDASPPPW